MITVKHNVAVFDNDIRTNVGYRYTTRAAYSSIAANARITRATLRYLDASVCTALDVGCGDGTYTADLKAARPSLDLSGFDPAARAVSLARARHSDIRFEVGDLLRPETFPAERFDLVIVRGVLHHLPNPQLALEHCRRLSDRLLIIEPNGNNPVLKLIEKASAYHRAHEEQSFSSKRLKRWCGDAGYRVAAEEFIGFVPFFFPTPLARLIHLAQPLLERIPFLAKIFGAQVVLMCQASEA